MPTRFIAMKINKALFLFLITILSIRAYSCDKTFDTKETIIFVDFNFVLGEVESAKKAACNQGKNFKVLPYGYEYSKKMGTYREREYKNGIKIKRCGLFYGDGKLQVTNKGSECRKTLEDHYGIKEQMHQETKQKIEDEISNFSAEDKEIYLEELYSLENLKQLYEEEPSESLKMHLNSQYSNFQKRLGNKNLETSLEEMGQDDIKPTSIIVSGHDGSGSYSGMTGGLSKGYLLTKLKDSFSEDQLQSLESVLLWGCYTATRNEVNWWDEKLPGLKVLAGFNGSGPSIGKLASNQMIYDILTSTEDFYQLTDENQIKNALKSIEGFIYTLGGIQVKTCDGHSWYYGRSKKGDHYYQDFGKSGLERCLDPKLLSDAKSQLEFYEKYFSGELPIPKDTSNGPLRGIYNTIRNYEDCKETWKGKLDLPNGSKVGMLLFYEGVKGNFYNLFSPLLQDASKAFERMDNLEIEMISKALGIGRTPPALPFTEEEILEEINKRGAIAHNPPFSDFIKWKNFKSDNNLEKFPTSKEEFMKLSRKEILDIGVMLEEFEGSDFINHASLKSEPIYYDDSEVWDNNVVIRYPIESSSRNISALKKAFNNYAYSLNSSCMNFLAWHEVTETTPYYLGGSTECNVSY